MSKWISVEERLPEIKDDMVLAYSARDGGIDMVDVRGFFQDIRAGIDEEGKQLYIRWYLATGLTHWMPLPQPPEADE